jgi:cyclic pyranopterin monophosphate synthase
MMRLSVSEAGAPLAGAARIGVPWLPDARKVRPAGRRLEKVARFDRPGRAVKRFYTWLASGCATRDRVRPSRAADSLAPVNGSSAAGPRPDDAPLTHVDARGRANMVDVSGKSPSARRAIAHAELRLDAATRALLLAGDLPKGEALAVARVAGIQAAKETARLIPLCHPLPLSHVAVAFEPLGTDGLRVVVEAATVGATGVEMEAMTGAAVAALTVYDMVKARCRGASITAVRLVHKSGGKSGTWDRPTVDVPPGAVQP